MTERQPDTSSGPDRSWLVRDLSVDVDMTDEDGAYGTKFHELFITDSEYEWPDLLTWYQNADDDTRAAISLTFVHLVGYTLPSIIDLAHGRSEGSLS